MSCGFCDGLMDRHSHILPGLDDGVGEMPDTIRCLEFFEQLGLKDVYCTPHVMEDFPNPTDLIQQRFAELQQEYTGPIRLHLGAEYMLDSLFMQRLTNRDLLVGEDGYLMVETFASNPSLSFISMIEEAMNAGYRVVLAHPERYKHIPFEHFDPLLRAGMRMQINIPSLLGAYGPNVYNRAVSFLQEQRDYIIGFGSDCHSPESLARLYPRPIDKSLVPLLLSYR